MNFLSITNPRRSQLITYYLGSELEPLKYYLLITKLAFNAWPVKN